VGALRVATTDVGSAEALWSRYGDAMGLTHDEYERYLDGAAQPCAIIVAATAVFSQPIRLPELRRRSRAFVVPQSYRFLPEHEAGSLLNGQHRQLAHLPAAPN
jgi:predicted transcriptional regulator